MIVGDSNVRRFVTHVNRHACAEHEDTQILMCGKLALIAEADVCLVAWVTNMLTSAAGSTAVGIRVEPVLMEIKSKLIDACSERLERYFHVYPPPMYQSNPLWYRHGLPEVMKNFLSILSRDQPRNLILMPGYSLPKSKPDAVHLTPYSGLEYIYYLFNSARKAR